MDIVAAKKILSEVSSLQMGKYHGKRSPAIAEWTSQYLDGESSYREAVSLVGKLQSGATKKPKQAQLELDPSDVVRQADDMIGQINITQVCREVYRKFGWAPNDHMMAFIFELLGHPAPSGSNNFATGRAGMKPEGWVFERSQDKRVWSGRLDPEFNKRRALQRQYAEETQRAQELRNQAAEVERKLQELKQQLSAVGGVA